MNWKSKKTPTEETTMGVKKELSLTKILAIGFGGLIAVAHVGVLGHLVKTTNSIKYPIVNLPTGRYNSYELNVSKEGYSVKYRADDPKTLTSERSLDVDKNKKGLFGGSSEKRSEYRKDEYTAEGYRNLQGGAAVDGEGKSAEDIECIVADAGARSQGAMAGTSIAAGALVPALINIPYIGWLAAGWVSLLGGKIGSEVGSEVGSAFNDC